MQFILCLIIGIFALPSLSAQALDTTYPDGLYFTLESFKQHLPDTSIKVRKLNLGVPSTEILKDTLVKHPLFLDKNNEYIDKVFAIVEKGEIYFQDAGIRKCLDPDYGWHNSFPKKS